MNLEQICKAFTKELSIALLNEFDNLDRVRDELINNFKPIFEGIYTNYCFDIEIYAIANGLGYR